MVLEYSNLFFSSLFAVEMFLKIVADGFFGYIKNGFNVFDSFIVILRFDRFSAYSSVFIGVYIKLSGFVGVF